MKGGRENQILDEPRILDKEINQLIHTIQPIQNTQKQYLMKLQQKQSIDRLEIKPNYNISILKDIAKNSEILSNSRSKECKNCKKEFSWRSKKELCRFCGYNVCKQCIAKKRIVPKSEQQSESICMDCESIYLKTKYLHNYHCELKKYKIGFTRLAEEQNQLEALIKIEQQKKYFSHKQKKLASTMLLNSMEITNLRNQNNSIENEIEQLKKKLQKAKQINSNLNRKYTDKKKKINKSSIRSISSEKNSEIHQDQNIQPPSALQQFTVQDDLINQKINQSFVNDMLTQSELKKINQEKVKQQGYCCNTF